MDASNWRDFQEAFIWTFGPFISYWLAFFGAFGFFAGVMVIWLAFLRQLTPD